MESRASRKALVALLAGLTIGAVAPSAFAAPRAGQGPWRTHELVRNQYLGTPAFLSGEFQVSAKAGDPVGVARAFLEASRDQIGIRSPASELEVLSVQGPDEVGMHHVKFAHKAHGLPVFGSELVVHLKGNVVTSLNGTYLPTVRERVDVRVQGDDAADLAIDFVRDRVNVGEIRGDVQFRFEGLDLDANPLLGFFHAGLLTGEKSGTELAWKLSINGYVVYVSARTGKVLEHFDNIHTALSREIYTAKNGTTLPGTLVCSDSKGCSSNDTDIKNAWNQFEETYNYFKSTHNRDSWDGRGGKLIGTTHYSQNFQNAYWNGSQMVFGDTFVIDDVTAHELGHGVCQGTANLTYKNQSGALNESYSDVWGAMVDREDWLIGEELPEIGAIRDMSDPNAFNQPKDMTEYKRMMRDNGGVHINSGIPNYAAYLLSDGGTNQGTKVVGQGRAVTEKIWYRTESQKLTSSSQFSDFARLTVEACGELFGKSSVQCTQTTNTMKAVKLM